MIYLFIKFIQKTKNVSLIILLFLVSLFLSCGNDDDSTPANYEGEASINIRYNDKQIEDIGSELPSDYLPVTIELNIYDSEENQVYFHQWNYTVFKKLVAESEDTPIILENIPAGPQQKIIVLLKDKSGNVSAHAENTAISIPASQTPTTVDIIVEKFYVINQVPENLSIYLKDTLKEFSWEQIPGAEEYKILFVEKTDFGENVVLLELTAQTNSIPSDSFIEIVKFENDSDKTNEQFFSFPDSAQFQFYNAEKAISNANLQPGQDYYGQDAQYDGNVPSYSTLEYNGAEITTINNSLKRYFWQIAAIDIFGNVGVFSRQQSFQIKPHMILDNVTGLTWESKTVNDNSNHEKDKLFTWQEAQDFINEMNQESFGGYTDWRLPKAQELSSIISFGTKDLFGSVINFNIKTDTKYFSDTVAAPYRSSTLLSYYSTPFEANISAWYIDFTDGTANEKNFSLEPIRVRAVRGETIESSLIDNGDGTVTDNATGLMWTKAAQGPMNWKQALGYCEELNLIYSDWRLPNRNELHSIIDYNLRAPYDTAAVDPTLIDPGTSDKLPFQFWSSTTDKSNPEQALTIDFQDGKITKNNKVFAQNIMVRAVRNAQ